ncbi:UDP-N-acetylglucosamine 2-epimerase [Halomonas sp. LR5S13]|uniref:UDP-N-acetylglucosamine 2-epimerase n=1 Tax=Halomonas rhizosphaerae TaxID=3043296 RepID=UPI0024A9D463|nr:UDP-N-acetylglucosamine 2-epimerase [Halomonas rhizosphaerae]MDI5920868.1 UDP-N-acetylglucosamine 2-epimerase [Halomonas rhizosphaerae]
MNRRRIWIVTTSRADYGLLYWLMREMEEDADLELQTIVTGSHLCVEFGMTVDEIVRDGFRVHRRIEIMLSSDSREAMVKAMGIALLGFGDALVQDAPDLLVVLGDRFEIVPVALAAVVHRIPVVHLHGGEVSGGALDEYFRHAVTKLASLHFPATELYRRRLLRMGEDPARTYSFGAPGLDHLHRSDLLSREALAECIGMPLDRPTALATYHPVTGEPDARLAGQIEALLGALESCPQLQVIFTKANADAMGRWINAQLLDWVTRHPERARFFDNLGHRVYLSCLRHLDMLVGNSSSGLIEAPSFGLPAINVGSRQEGRLQADNVISVEPVQHAIGEAISLALDPGFRDGLKDMVNPYDPRADGQISRRIKDVLKTVLLDEQLMKKPFHVFE